ncbi:MAG TPA: hemolysin family protein [Thermomicrobiales bacterium]|nr:hemolysin family protein [Thermomicrobiales bacterium]
MPIGTVASICSHRPPFGLEDPISTAFGLIAIIVLVLLNGFFVATEFALVSVRRTRIQQLSSEGDSRATRVLDRIDHLDTYIAATQLGITMASLALGWIGEPALAHVLHPLIERLPFEVSSTVMHTISFVVAFSIVTALHIVLGELAPKSLALQRPEETSLLVGEPIHWFLIVFRPVINALNWVGNQVVRMLGFEPAQGHELVQSAEELMIALDASREAGLVTQTAHDILDRAFSFTDLQAREVMVPRTEVTALPADASLDDVVRMTVDTSYTRLPVYEGDSDNIIGIIKAKRMLPLFLQWAAQRAPQTALPNGSAPHIATVESSDRAANGTADITGLTPHAVTRDPNGTTVADTFRLSDYMVEPTLVPETLAVSEVLTRMQETHVQMAVVIDEYGGTAGIVTLQDIVNRLLGRLTEEEDEASGSEGLAADGTIHLDGLTSLSELKDEYGIDLADDGLDVDTIGGYVFFRLGRAAQIDDEVQTSSGERIVVEALDGLRVARVRLLGRAALLEEDQGARDTLRIPA